MPKMFLIAATILCCGFWAVAQNTPDTNQPNPTGQTAGAPSSSATTQGATSAMKVDGCLSGVQGAYTLKEKSSGATYKLAGDTSQLRAHVGHEVEVIGSLSSTSTTSGSSDVNTSASQTTMGNASGLNSDGTIRVTSLKHVAESCGQ